MSTPPTVSPADLARAVAVLHSGGLVAFPTETVYGLGCDAESPEALRHLYAVKRRPAEHPVIVHAADTAALDVYAIDVPDVARRIVAELWPGPLTLVVRRSARIPDEVTGGRETVGLRVPDEPTALALLGAFGGAVAAPSANRFGRVSPTTAAHVHADLGDDVDLVLDGGPSRVGVESTIVDCSSDEPAILRVGGVPQAVIEEVLGASVALRTGGEVAAPGTLPGHYAPRARVVLVDERAAGARAAGLLAAGERVGLLMLAPVPSGLPGGLVVLDPPADVDEFARSLYARLREADRAALDVVLAVAPPADGMGAAVADRLLRAAAASAAP
jgi:L-threonylcarbamoyladenylate synthase